MLLNADSLNRAIQRKFIWRGLKTKQSPKFGTEADLGCESTAELKLDPSLLLGTMKIKYTKVTHETLGNDSNVIHENLCLADRVAMRGTLLTVILVNTFNFMTMI